ncbi:Hypothetical protein NTJ_16155 [Nesidiocoris tenuis]|uniref:Uncharacterized protein n=1 Tax=Nesidiocoris tenuis TaxID=355587 RepID=A0ABN7BII7_9HEMI|nr:Hypothetical protein NTJ_16155 [Nesidiocoris tenuis]
MNGWAAGGGVGVRVRIIRISEHLRRRARAFSLFRVARRPAVPFGRVFVAVFVSVSGGTGTRIRAAGNRVTAAPTSPVGSCSRL